MGERIHKRLVGIKSSTNRRTLDWRLLKKKLINMYSCSIIVFFSIYIYIYSHLFDMIIIIIKNFFYYYFRLFRPISASIISFHVYLCAQFNTLNILRSSLIRSSHRCQGLPLGQLLFGLYFVSSQTCSWFWPLKSNKFSVWPYFITILIDAYAPLHRRKYDKVRLVSRIYICNLCLM